MRIYLRIFLSLSRMKKFLLLFFLFPLLFSLQAAGSPDFQAVLTALLSTYEVPDPPKGAHYELAKKPEGIYIYLYTPDPIAPTAEAFQLFWSRKKERYVKLSFPKAEKKTEKQIEKQLSAFKQPLSGNFGYFFNLNTYYGYPGWADDVIALHEGAENLSNQELNSLARSHSEKGTEALAEKAVYRIGAHPFDEQYELSDVPPGRIESGIRHFKKAIACYKLLLDRDPAYQTLVGNIALKYWHEHVTAWYELMIMGLEEEAQSFIEPDLYNTFYRAYGKNLLNNCEEGAFLLTAGDADTYLPLYLQEKEGYRSDVTVINTHLIHTGRYIHYLREKKGVPLTLPQRHYKSRLTESIILKTPQKDPSLSLASFFARFSDSAAVPFDTITLQEKNYLQLSCHRFYTNAYYDGAPTRIAWRIPEDTRYLHRNMLFFYDLLHSDSLKRPVHVNMGISHDFTAPFSSYIHRKGLVAQLIVNDRDQQNHYQYEWKTDTKALADYLESQFDPGNTEELTPEMLEDESIIKHYRYVYYYLAHNLYMDEEKKRAQHALEEGLSLFPDEIAPFEYSTAYLAVLYYELDEPEKGDAILTTIVNRIKAYMDTLPAHPGRQEKMKVRNYTYSLHVIYSIAKSFDRRDVMRQVAEETLRLKEHPAIP